VPATLQRPMKGKIGDDDVQRYSLNLLVPQLAKLPGNTIRAALHQHSAAFLAGLEAVQIPHTMPSNTLPLSLDIHVPNDRAHTSPPAYPTHILALSTPFNGMTPPDAPFSLTPIHGALLAANSADVLLPPLERTSTRGCIRLPVIRVIVPSVQAFVILRSYMYTGRIEAFLSALVPLPASFIAKLRHPAQTLAAAFACIPELQQLTQHLIDSTRGGLPAYVERLGHIRAVWETMWTLKMGEQVLWKALDLAWELARGAMDV
ncbi:hypothetical protein C8R44DRAFT_574084, partial [Mycena epipterygia]